MHFSKNIYLSEKLKKKEKSLKRKIKYDKGFSFLYLIYKNQRNGEVEFMQAYFFKQKYLKKLPIEIIGICDSYNDAVNYLASLVCSKYNVDLLTE